MPLRSGARDPFVGLDRALRHATAGEEQDAQAVLRLGVALARGLEVPLRSNAGGIGIGIAMYAGLLRIPLRWFFTVTGVLVLLLAAGMAGQAAHFLIQAGLLPPLAEPLWDTSAVLPNPSPLGEFLHALMGYEARPAGMQALFFGVVLSVVYAGARLVRRRST